jgi:hypothetical protein
MNARIAAVALFLLPMVGACQGAKLRLPDFQPLADKATDSVNISVSPWLLRTMTSLVDAQDADGVKTKEILGRIQSIDIRSYEFATDFVYSRQDIESVRRQLTGPGWTQLMQSHNREKGEDLDIYLSMENNRTTGFALIACEPREFTIINIVGSVSAEDLPKIENYLHLPKRGVGEQGVNLGTVGQQGVSPEQVNQQVVKLRRQLSNAGWLGTTL